MALGQQGVGLDQLTSQPGTYALLLPSDERRALQVGRLGSIKLDVGLYIYVGSALGAGGLRSRIQRHLRPRKKLHWHIDYLAQVIRPVSILWVYSDRRVEHAWARALSRASEAGIPIHGFGASDCRCLSHLLFFPGTPDMHRIRERLEGASPRDVALHRLELHPREGPGFSPAT